MRLVLIREAATELTLWLVKTVFVSALVLLALALVGITLRVLVTPIPN